MFIDVNSRLGSVLFIISVHGSHWPVSLIVHAVYHLQVWVLVWGLYVWYLSQSWLTLHSFLDLIKVSSNESIKELIMLIFNVLLEVSFILFNTAWCRCTAAISLVQLIGGGRVWLRLYNIYLLLFYDDNVSIGIYHLLLLLLDLNYHFFLPYWLQGF